MNHRKKIFTILSLSIVIVLAGCSDDPTETPQNPEDGDPIQGAVCMPSPSYTEDLSNCMPDANYYLPRDLVNVNRTMWPICISDDGAYHQVIEGVVSSIARTEAYQTIAVALWEQDPKPKRQNFIDMRILYEEAEGLGSRVSRRYDPHYDPPASGKKCEDDETVPIENPNYCVGPATLRPNIIQAFVDGAEGKKRVVNAAKIHAALQWFLYVSVIKESTTCADKSGDCDSSWAYYNGGKTTRDEAIGLAAEIRALMPETHNRVFDGVLAVRCWRDLVDTADPAGNEDLHRTAINQTDMALQRAVAVLVRQQFAQLTCATGDYREAALEALRILVPLLDHAVRIQHQRPTEADFLLAEINKEADAIDFNQAISDLDSIFECY